MKRAHHIKICVTILMMTLMSGILLPREASCRLAGEADFSYVDFDSRDNNGHNSANSLTQRYSVLYEKSGKFVSGRLGRYNVALGYEWLTFDTNSKSSAAPPENLSDSRGHIIYNGELFLDPKEIPLRLKLYSMDMNKSSFAAGFNTQGNLFAAPSTYSGISGTPLYTNMPSNTTTGIYGGKRIDSGATLVAGVKNGMTNGYNEVLRHFPMLMLDYRDVTNKDRDSLYPVDNRLTRLAFVSLNKKDNWFHFRYVTYNDNIDSTNNYNETQIQLGTVDYTLQRRWIDFSNWMNVSVDGQLTKRMQARSDENYEEFSLNLFGRARRQSWELRTFNNFTRLNEVNRDRLTYRTSLPVYANGIISPTANWSAYTKYDNNQTDGGEYFTTVTGGYTIDAFRKSSFTLSQGLGVEQVTASGNSDRLILTGTVGTASTPLFSRDVSLKAVYNIRNFRTDNINGTSDFIDHEINGVAGYNLSNQLRITAEQVNRFTTGTAQRISSGIPGAATNSPQYQAPRTSINSGGSSYQSITALKIAWAPKPRLSIGFSASEDIYAPVTGERNIITKVVATLGYTGNNLKISSITSYTSGSATNSELADRFDSTTSANYIFSRNLDARVGVSYLRTFGVKDKIDTINVAQSLNYYYYQFGGIARKLFEISESFTSVEELVISSIATETAANTKQRTNTSLLGVKYHPLRQMMIAGGARYSFVNSFENSAVNYYTSLSVQFKLLDASLDYSYGKNKTDNRVEKRISANVKKRF